MHLPHGEPPHFKKIICITPAINDYVKKKFYEEPTQRLQTWPQKPKPEIWFPKHLKGSLYETTPALKWRKNLGFLISQQLLLSPFDKGKICGEIKTKRKLFLFQHFGGEKIEPDLPKTGLEEILFPKSIDELAPLLKTGRSPRIEK
ncbi:hypothetical protein TNIN_202081 [Trichonephila inaurata madagascariensis]|uniref:Uncharacterized protein n=1 Tax=Trichonephila inaurata madagascariensis TaxID=2747483 RepID=A0A8X6XYI8_9ARAC|nr:hypothetical protein TNIN_202081 [Trichonephila inaurata madagascariensis]